MGKHFWTYAADAKGEAVFRAHRSHDAALACYSLMRGIGGPRRIGCTSRPGTRREIERFAAATFKAWAIAE